MPFCSSDFTSFTLPTMLAATPPGAQATFVAINGMLSTTPPGPQLTTNPGSMLAMQSGIGSSTFIPNQNLTAGPYFFPSGFPSGSPNLTCTVPFSSPQFQPSILPFFTPGGNNMLATNPPNPITLSSPFSGPLSHLIHQPPGNPINPFPSSISGASLINPLGIPTSTLQDASQIPMNTLSSTLVSNQIPSNSVVLPTLSITVANGSSTDSLPLSLTLPSSNAVFSSDSLVGLTSPSITSVCTATSIYTATAFPSVPSSSAPTTVTSSISLPGTSSNPTTEVTSEHICVTPTLRSSFKIDKSQSIAPTTTSTDGACSTGLHALESVDFHRDAILDAIDKLRERKARPDFERISCLLKRYQNINPDQTQLCLGRLAAAGAVVCVDYKGNLSYRNPSKWRKTATSSSVTNPANITQRLVEAIRYLISGPMDRSSLCVQPGPNGGYSLFQIERALQTLRAKSETSQKAVPELIGATLRVCLDREATHGKLAKTIDGRYLLDESGERKKLANISTTLPTMLLNKKPLPPNSLSTAFLAPSGTSKYAKVPTTIAPAGEYITTNRPLAVKQVPVNAVSIAPVGARSLHSSPVGNSLSMRPAISRRGRPPGSKSRKLNCTNEVPEKKMKLEAPPGNVSPSNTGVDIVGRPTSTVPPLSNGVMKSNNLGFKAAPSNPFVSTSPNGFCSSATMSLPPSFITSNSVCSAIFPGPLIPTSFATATMGDISLSQGLTGPFLTLPAPSACAVSCASGMLPPTSSSVLPTDLTTFSKAYSPVKSSESLHSMDYLVQTMDSGASEKSFECEASVCCRCGGPATKEEAFLICKDCCLCAHPTCLDYWPELTDRARQAPWQCADCKTCAVCQNKQPTVDLLICDACDKGFHPGCHSPKLQEPVDRSLPWVCSDCQKEGYSVAIGTLPNGSFVSPVHALDNTSVTEKSADQKPGSEGEEDSSMDRHTASSAIETHQSEDNHTSSAVKSEADTPTVHMTANLYSPSVVNRETVSVEQSKHEFISELRGSKGPTHRSTSDSEASSTTRSDTEPAVSNQASEPSEISVKDSPITQGRDDCESKPRSDMLPSASCPASPLPSKVIATVGPDHPEQNSLCNECPEKGDMETTSSSDFFDNLENTPNHEHIIRPTDVRLWTVDQVREWLLEEGFPREAEAFLQQEIDGACLLLMKRMDVLTELGIKLGPAVKIYERIKRLQSRCSSPTVLSN